MKQKLIMLILLSSLVICSSAYAIGISPSKEVIEFEPNLETEITYHIINNLDVELYVEISVSSQYLPLKDYITLKETSAYIPPQTREPFSYTLKLPSSMTPGSNQGGIKVMSGAPPESAGGTGVVVRSGVIGLVQVNVPYPGYYVIPTVTAEDVEINERSKVTISLANRGKETTTIEGSVNIYDSENTLLSTLSAGSTELGTTETGSLTATWDGTDKAGMYLATAIITYNGETKNTSANFYVGTEQVDIINASATWKNDSIFLEGKGIDQIGIKVKSLWNDPIEDAYAELVVRDLMGNEVYSTKTPTKSLSPWALTTLDAFIDAKRIGAGSYTIDVTVHFGGKTTTKSFKLLVAETIANVEESAEKAGMGGGWVPYVLIAALVLVTGGIIFMFKRIT